MACHNTEIADNLPSIDETKKRKTSGLLGRGGFFYKH